MSHLVIHIASRYRKYSTIKTMIEHILINAVDIYVKNITPADWTKLTLSHRINIIYFKSTKKGICILNCIN